MATVVHPARKKRAQILARRFLERRAQVLSAGRRILVRLVIISNAAKERFVTQVRAQHVQHPRALLIIVRVEQIHEIFGVAIEDRRALLLLIRKHIRRPHRFMYC